ncbi:MAG: hypothetical protein KC413_01170 [Anaerolineales bacterium]|nr:hypothetical protein [Anaerolineales bacterium]
MIFIFRGNVCGRICDECSEPLSRVVIRLYRPAVGVNVALQAAAATKHTLAALPADAVRAKEDRLPAQTMTDEQGNFAFELDGDKLDYSGDAFEIDVRLDHVPHQVSDRHDPVQVTITTLQPAWRERDNVLVAYWEYCLPARIWCAIRALFDAWVICGRVVVGATGAPVPNVVVRAFDNDWITDDPLGQATTNSNGRFRIDYTSLTFKQTFLSPVINVETPLFAAEIGPDVYFHVDTQLNVPLLHEDPSVGYTSSRENIGNCFCVTLTLEEDPGDDTQIEPLPVFNRVGGYNFLTQIDSLPAGDGKTLSDDRAFYSTLRLNGILPKRINGNPCEYMFEVAEWSGGILGGYTQVPLAHIAKTHIGDLQRVTADPINPVQTDPYFVNGNPATELVASVTVDGWIQVPQQSNAYGPGYFQPNGNMIRLISTQLTSQVLDMAGLLAGQSATSTGQPLAQNHYFAIRMWVREAGNPASAHLAGTCQKLAICNARYDNVPQGGSWAPSSEDNALAAHTIDIDELKTAGGCAKITTSLTVLYTAAAANLGAVTVSMTGPGGPYSFAPIASSPDTFGTAVPLFNVATLAPCAYTVQISVQVLLTTGDSIPDNLWDQLAFCK